jgi:hypothetical protein
MSVSIVAESVWDLVTSFSIVAESVCDRVMSFSTATESEHTNPVHGQPTGPKAPSGTQDLTSCPAPSAQDDQMRSAATAALQIAKAVAVAYPNDI